MRDMMVRVQCRLPLAADESNGIKMFLAVMKAMTAQKCSFPGCDNHAMEQGRGPCVCADHDPGR